ncbi:DUF1616 domain-containing protein [Spongiactinospora sp. TRM90649]|uniref:DUF1616 domain-containing protein n=1 Tax=Spongiactinospora sp. TRM90649 TaxID=3031114 RepID=UPI0023F904FB|nr:DUF1616 domain-containing protein [Spongiactinospora sp. TRM90649]MDF5757253.1 DUF1616 domain-containing protein [Spongiactinospora sp. TRM90649]
MRATRRARWPLVLLATTGWLALAATGLAPESPVRVTATLLFLLLCPGAAVLALVRPLLGPRDHSGDAMESAALTFAISVALGMLVTAGYYMTGTFTMQRAVITLASITSAGALGALVTRPWMRARRAKAGAASHTAPAPPEKDQKAAEPAEPAEPVKD